MIWDFSLMTMLKGAFLRRWKAVYLLGVKFVQFLSHVYLLEGIKNIYLNNKYCK